MTDTGSITSSSLSFDMMVHDHYSIEDEPEFYPRSKTFIDAPNEIQNYKETLDYNAENFQEIDQSDTESQLISQGKISRISQNQITIDNQVSLKSELTYDVVDQKSSDQQLSDIISNTNHNHPNELVWVEDQPQEQLQSPNEQKDLPQPEVKPNSVSQPLEHRQGEDSSTNQDLESKNQQTSRTEMKLPTDRSPSPLPEDVEEQQEVAAQIEVEQIIDSQIQEGQNTQNHAENRDDTPKQLQDNEDIKHYDVMTNSIEGKNEVISQPAGEAEQDCSSGQENSSKLEQSEIPPIEQQESNSNNQTEVLQQETQMSNQKALSDANEPTSLQDQNEISFTQEKAENATETLPHILPQVEKSSTMARIESNPPPEVQPGLTEESKEDQVNPSKSDTSQHEIDLPAENTTSAKVAEPQAAITNPDSGKKKNKQKKKGKKGNKSNRKVSPKLNPQTQNTQLQTESNPGDDIIEKPNLKNMQNSRNSGSPRGQQSERPEFSHPIKVSDRELVGSMNEPAQPEVPDTIVAAIDIDDIQKSRKTMSPKGQNSELPEFPQVINGSNRELVGSMNEPAQPEIPQAQVPVIDEIQKSRKSMTPKGQNSELPEFPQPINGSNRELVGSMNEPVQPEIPEAAIPDLENDESQKKTIPPKVQSSELPEQKNLSQRELVGSWKRPAEPEIQQIQVEPTEQEEIETSSKTMSLVKQSSEIPFMPAPDLTQFDSKASSQDEPVSSTRPAGPNFEVMRAQRASQSPKGWTSERLIAPKYYTHDRKDIKEVYETPRQAKIDDPANSSIENPGAFLEHESMSQTFSEKSPFMAEDADLRSGKRSPLKGSTQSHSPKPFMRPKANKPISKPSVAKKLRQVKNHKIDLHKKIKKIKKGPSHQTNLSHTLSGKSLKKQTPGQMSQPFLSIGSDEFDEQDELAHDEIVTSQQSSLQNTKERLSQDIKYWKNKIRKRKQHTSPENVFQFKGTSTTYYILNSNKLPELRLHPYQEKLYKGINLDDKIRRYRSTSYKNHKVQRTSKQESKLKKKVEKKLPPIN